MNAIRSLFYFYRNGCFPPDNQMEWHECDPFLPVRTIDAGWSNRVWRRKRWDGKWEYKDRPMTEEERMDELRRRAW